MKINKNEIQIKHLNTSGDDGNNGDDDDVCTHKMFAYVCAQTIPIEERPKQNQFLHITIPIPIPNSKEVKWRTNNRPKEEKKTIRAANPRRHRHIRTGEFYNLTNKYVITHFERGQFIRCDDGEDEF